MPYEFEMTRRVQFAETDMAGVVHFAHYFRLFEEVEHAFYRSMGLSIMMLEAGAEIGWPRAFASCEYCAAGRVEKGMRLGLRALELGNKSLTYEVDFFHDETLVARGKITKVCGRITETAFESIPIPDGIRARIREAMDKAR